MEWISIFVYFGIGYAILYTGSKIIFSAMSLLEIRIYFWRYDHIIEEHELNEHLQKNKHEMPLISIISPAYNEGVLIIDTVSSFLNQSYKNKEIIVCSDGGSDNTLEQLIRHFELVEVPDTFEHSPHITHKPIHRYFRSTNPKFADLIVLDKENGGKADAQNAGVAIARGEIVTIIDADSILERYALIHLADIFEREGRVIGVGTPIGVVNDCNVGPDGVDDASVPKSFWAKIQVIEYLRSFLLGRMFAQRYRGLQIVSGAFGVYKKWIIEAVGGYSTGSLAEDMDVDAKIWRYIDTNKLKYRIRYIPEAFCWSEVPDTFKSLASQRDRWARGMTETIWKNKDLFFNPKFTMLGLFSFPYYVFFEWLTPFIEVVGLLFFVVGVAIGWFPFFILWYILLIYWVIGILMNIIALSVEAFTRGHYKDRRTLLRLSFYALLEPLFYHWINSFLYVIGNLRLLVLRKKGWGEMERVGLKKLRVESGDAQTEVSNGQTWLRVAAVFLVLLLASAGTWYFAFYKPGLKDGARDPMESPVTATVKRDDESENRLQMEPESLQKSKSDSISARLVAADSVTSREQQEKEPDPVATERPGITPQGGEFASEVEVLSTATGRYYIVIASARSMDNMVGYANKLRSTGVASKIIPPFQNRTFNFLTVADFSTMAEAQEKLDQFKAQFGDDIWVLKY
jgi:biofilm PGA synthesis N-glycosyltransferase PgaC